ncbi:MAG: hypothetical protein ABFD89_26865 [Bryobacteraceae bacterium]
MTTPTYRIGPAAKMLETSTYRLRALCKAGLVETELDDSGQWRIPVEEVTRLEKEGLPPVPRATPDPDAGKEAAPPAQASPDPEESEEVRLERDGVSIAAHRLQRRKLELEEAEVEDAFQARENRRQAEQREAAQRQAEAEAATAREQWEERTIENALATLPYDCPPALKVQAHEKLRNVLRTLGPDNSQSVVQKVVTSTVDTALEPYFDGKRVQKSIEDAIRELPYCASRKDWEAKARKLADAALRSHEGPRDQATLNRVAKEAASATVQECRHAQRLAEVVVTLRYWRLYDATDEERAEVTKAVLAALSRLPVGASSADIDKAKEEALRPFERAVESRLRAATRKREASAIAAKAVQILSHYLTTDYKWDSFSEESETCRDLAEELRPLIEKKYLAGSIDYDELDEYVQEWTDEHIDADEEED